MDNEKLSLNSHRAAKIVFEDLKGNPGSLMARLRGYSDGCTTLQDQEGRRISLRLADFDVWMAESYFSTLPLGTIQDCTGWNDVFYNYTKDNEDLHIGIQRIGNKPFYVATFKGYEEARE